LAGPSITVDAGMTATINSPVTGSAGLIKSGAGTLVLGAANTYGGTTTVAGGVLNLLNATGSATGTGPVAVDAAGQLGGTGIAQGDVTNNGTVSPGVGIGSLRIGGAFTQGDGGSLDITLADLSNDKLEVTGLATLAGILNVSLAAGFMPVIDDVFEVVTASGFGGTTFTSVVLPSITSDLAWSVNYGATAVTLAVVAAVEPGDFNNDGVVDAADFVAWRKANGSAGGYADWMEQFGETSGGGAVDSVPEPGWTLQITAVVFQVICPSMRRRMSRGAPTHDGSPI
jgi:autotransporter-associated beta strand protein